jgi:ferric-dicitrate binding protein FerR (iron transport regulator)
MEIDKDLIIKFLTKEISSEEETLLLSWVEASDENKTEFADIKNAWALAEMSEDRENLLLKNQYKTLLNKIQQIKAQKGKYSFAWSIKDNTWFWKIAAALIVTAGISSLLGYFAGNRSNSEQLLNVVNGKQTCLQLADGTKIWLNSGSSLQYPASFKGKTREVTLSGEGYFEVAHNENKPFIVNTSSLKVKVIGTSFNLSAYDDDKDAKITLEKGAVSIVSLNGNNEMGRLRPGQMAVYSKSEQQLKLMSVETNLYSSWKNGQFKFKRMSFEELAKKLGRKYNVNFIFLNKELKQTTYNGSFYNYEPLESVLKVMQTNSPFVYNIQKDTVYVK